MERQKKIEILEDAVERSFVLLDTGDYGPGALKDLVDAIAGMECLLDMEHTRFGVSESCSSAGMVIDFPASVESEPDEPEVDPEPEAPAAEEVATMSKTELRERVSALANKHPDLDAFAVMQSMGYSTLSSMPASRYAEYLSKVEAAAGVK